MFDLGGVIVAHDNALLYRTLAGRFSTPDPALIRRIAEHPPFGTGEKPMTQMHQEMAAAGYGGDWVQFVADWSCHFSVDWRMLELVERLAGERRVLLFSNTNAEHWRYLVAATDGRLARIEHYLSHEIGMLKPAPAAFAEVARRSGVVPAETVFIDDVEINVLGARAAGFQGITFTGQTALCAALGLS